MLPQHGPWKIDAMTEKHRDSFLTVQEDRRIRPNGRSGNYAAATVKPGMAVLPVDRNGITCLVGQFRYALRA